MKTRNKVLGLSLGAAALVGASVMGTMAYLTSQDTVTNTFTVGKVSITLDEADVKTDGTYETDATVRVDANAYHLFPGHEYIKDPVVHVTAGSDDCYVFVKVENGISAIEADTTIADQMAAKGWTLLAGETDTYYYENVIADDAADKDIEVFDNFTIADDANVSGYDSANIKITAYAVQADGFNSAEAAWTATFGNSGN